MPLLTPEQWRALTPEQRQQIMMQSAYEAKQEDQKAKKKPGIGSQVGVAMSPAAGYLGISYATGSGPFAPSTTSTAAPQTPQMISASRVGDAGTVSTGAQAAQGAQAAETGTTATTGTSGGATTGSTWGAVAPWLSIGALGLETALRSHNAYQRAEHKGWGGGLKQGLRSAGWMNYVPLLGQAAWIAGAVRGGLGGKKEERQYARDAGRKGLKELGLLNDNYELDLGDGQTFNIGKEDPWSDAEKSQYGGERQYDLSEEALANPEVAQQLQPLIGGGGVISLFTPTDDKGRGQMTGYLVNAATKTKDPYAWMRSKLDQIGGQKALTDAIQNSENLKDEDKLRHVTALNMIYGSAGYERPSWGKPWTDPNAKQAAPAPQEGQSVIVGKLAEALKRKK